MATKTVVCPECGSEAAPGRFACPECGALLASVGAFDPLPPGEPAPPPAGEPEPEADLEPEPVATAAVHAPAWPPDGDRGSVARPVPRIPAGAYLSPSAVLAPPDPPPAMAATHDHQAGGAMSRRLPDSRSPRRSARSGSPTTCRVT